MNNHCYSCACELVPTFKPTVYENIPGAVFDPFSGQRLNPDHYSDALTVVFGGGYGEYFDDSDFRAIICEDCVDNLRAVVPWIDHMLGFARGDHDNPEYLPDICKTCDGSKLVPDPDAMSPFGGTVGHKKSCPDCSVSNTIEKSKQDHPTAIRTTVTDAVNRFRLQMIKGEKS